MARRETFSKIPLQGNYYPMPTLAFLQDKTRRFSVHTRQAVGVASLKGGWLEMMLDRRLVQVSALLLVACDRGFW
jgi:alpha-mannosidase II